MSDRIFDAIEKVAIAPDIPVADKVKLIDELRKGMPAINDRWTVRYIVLGLIAIAVIPIAFFSLGTVFFKTDSVPDSIVAITSAAIGALATYLTPLRRGEDNGRAPAPAAPPVPAPAPTPAPGPNG